MCAVCVVHTPSVRCVAAVICFCAIDTALGRWGGSGPRREAAVIGRAVAALAVAVALPMRPFAPLHTAVCTVHCTVFTAH